MMVSDNASSTSTTNTPTLIPTLIPISARNLIEEWHESIAAHKQKQTLEKDVNDLKDNREGNITELQCEMDIQMSEKVQVGTGNAARIGDVLAASRNSFEEPHEGYSSKSMPKLNERSCLQSTRATVYDIKAWYMLSFLLLCIFISVMTLMILVSCRTTGHDYMIPWRNTKEPAEDINDMHYYTVNLRAQITRMSVMHLLGKKKCELKASYCVRHSGATWAVYFCRSLAARKQMVTKRLNIQRSFNPD
ncbi:hypothetical protein M422DRAFT_53847 [Sphaerobolus stellatus SS14]|uniref:Uncharacterized protein n=1 Tax=Sphaerobolus stellatus (strain SS14) TaxID=990650 RepID=A0A0C9U7A0_SPHS4|nr:hypothetical protein M422DRAFT_53847 [Sphaerobolus stellatus SS14]